MASHRAAMYQIRNDDLLYFMQRREKHALTELKRHPATQEEITLFLHSVFYNLVEIVQTTQQSRTQKQKTSTGGIFLDLFKHPDLLPSFSPKHTILYIT